MYKCKELDALETEPFLCDSRELEKDIGVRGEKVAQHDRFGHVAKVQWGQH